MKKNLLLLSGICILSAVITNPVNAQEVWTPSELAAFGTSNNYSIRAMLPFKGSLYAGTANTSGQIYRSATGNVGSWTGSLADSSITAINALTSTTDGGGYMYTAISTPFGTGSIYRTFDGVTWNLYHAAGSAIKNIIPFKGMGTTDTIYSVEYNSYGDMILRSAYDSNDPQNTFQTWDTVLDFSQVQPYTSITSSVIHNNKLYIGTGYPFGILSTDNGTTWSMNSYTSGGFGDGNNTYVSAMGSYSGYLYAATYNYTTGTQIWRSNNDTAWTMVAQYSGFEKVTSFITVGTDLWANVAGSSSGKLIKSSDGVTFNTSVSNGFGYANNHMQYGNFAVFGNNLYYGSENFGSAPLVTSPGTLRGGGFSTGGQIWRTCIITPPVISIGGDQSVCLGTAANFNADPGFVSYLWEDGSTNQLLSTMVKGEHYVIATDVSGCDATDTARLDVMPVPDLYLTNPSSGNVTICKGDSINIAGTAVSNVRLPQPPISKVTNVPISYSLGNTYDTIAVTGISECSCTSLYSITIDSLYHQYDSDVSIVLYSPSGSHVDLAAGAPGSNYIGTEFTPSAGMIIGNFGAAPYTGQFLPSEPFTNLTGSATGNWVIQLNDNYVTDDGVLKGWTLKFSVADSIITYSWNPSTGVSISSELNTTITPPASAMYTITAYNDLGCSVKDTISVFVPSIITAASYDSICYGMSTTLSTDGSLNTSWSPSGSLSSATGTSVIATPATSTMYYAMEVIAGCVATDSVMVTVNAPIIVDAGTDQTICSGDSASISGTATGGTLPYNLLWSGGTDSFNSSAATVSPTTATTYNFFVTDAFGCTKTDSLAIVVAPNTDVYGHVGYTGGNVIGSSVVLYKYYPYLTHFDTVQTTVTDASGDFHFASVSHQDYLVEVFPAAGYTSLVPTYYGNSFIWDSASVVNHYCAINDTLNILSVEETGSAGPGYLHGRIVEDTGFVRVPGDPIPGVDVKLGRNPGSQLVTSTQTDSNGEYQFTGVAYGSYTVYADIPGLGRDSSYTFTVDSANSVYNYLNYIVDSATIYIVPDAGVGIQNIAAKEDKFSVYPNPSKGNATIEYRIGIDADVTLAVYNMLGVKVTELVNTHQQAGTYKYNLNDKNSSLKSGVYFVTLVSNGKTNIHKIIITE